VMMGVGGIDGGGVTGLRMPKNRNGNIKMPSSVTKVALQPKESIAVSPLECVTRQTVIMPVLYAHTDTYQESEG
jgi:hypothetical protein